MEFALREFRKEDFDALWQIDQHCFAPEVAYTRRELAAYICRGGSFTVVAEDVPAEGAWNSRAVQSPAVVGFIIAEANRRGRGHIITIDVVPTRRRYGLGSKLLLEAEKRLGMIRCHSVLLETAVDNRAALAFYKRHGYELMKIIPHYYSNGVDALMLEKKLASEAEAIRRQG